MTQEGKKALEKLTNHYKRPPRNCLVSRKLEYDGMKKAFEELSRRQAEWEKQLDELAEEFIRAWKGEPY